MNPGSSCWILAQEAPYSFLLDGVKGAKEYRTGVSTDPETVGITAEDEATLVVKLITPADHFLKILCHHAFSPLHRSIREAIRKGEEVPGLGNGPFYQYNQNEEGITFLRNELYWDVKNVNLKEIHFIYNDDEAKEAELFNQGKLHWSMGNILLDDVENRESIVINPLFATTYYFFSSKTPPFDNPEIRRALALLLPWEEIRSADYFYTPAVTLIPTLDQYPEAQGIRAQNTEEADKLLAQAGYPGGRGLPELVLLLPQGLKGSRTTELIFKSWADTLETNVRLEYLPSDLYYSALSEPGVHPGNSDLDRRFRRPLNLPPDVGFRFQPERRRLFQQGLRRPPGGRSSPAGDKAAENPGGG